MTPNLNIKVQLRREEKKENTLDFSFHSFIDQTKFSQNSNIYNAKSF